MCVNHRPNFMHLTKKTHSKKHWIQDDATRSAYANSLIVHIEERSCSECPWPLVAIAIVRGSAMKT